METTMLERYFPGIEARTPFPLSALCSAHAEAVEDYGDKVEGSFWPYGREVSLQLGNLVDWPVVKNGKRLLAAYEAAKDMFLRAGNAGVDGQTLALEACRAHMLFAVQAWEPLFRQLGQHGFDLLLPALAFLKKMPMDFESDFHRRTSIPMADILQLAGDQMKGRILHDVMLAESNDKPALYDERAAKVDAEIASFPAWFRARDVGGEELRARERSDADFSYFPDDRHERACRFIAELALDPSKAGPGMARLAEMLKFYL